jgi:uncharacterized protein
MRIRRTVAGVALTTLSAGLLATIPFTAAQAASPNLVISQVYGAGGNTGATYNADFVEIFNRGTAPVSLAGKSIQYASATGTGTFQGVALNGVTIPAGGYYLVQLASGTNGVALPTSADQSAGNPNLSGSAGKVALINQSANLPCNGGSDPCTATESAQIIDLVGYGGANFYETAAAPALTADRVLVRANDGRTDTDVNRDDFAAVLTSDAPAPRNSGNDGAPVEATIAQVQGDGTTSPLAGRKVTVSGVVTGDYQTGGYGGFFLQSTTEDGNPLTSDGIRVFRNSPDVAVGDLVTVTGPVEEFASSGNLYDGSETQLGGSSVVTVTGTADVPAPETLSLPFAPAADGVDGQERYEGMQVTLPSGLIATDLFTLGRFGEVSLTTDELLRIPTNAAEDAANNADRITLDDGLSSQNLAKLPYTVDEDGKTLPRAGDALAEPVTGLFSFSFGEYRVEPVIGTTAGFERRNERTNAPDAVGGDVQVASFNVLNYFVHFGGDNRGADSAAELARQQAKLVSAITALDADVVGLIEIANDGGEALDTLVAALNEAQPDAADDYTAVDAPALTAPTTLGGTYGTDAIRTAIIYRASVVTPAGPPPSDAALLNPADPGFGGARLFDRPPAVQAFTPAGGGEEFTVLVNHLKSKGSTRPQCGPADPFGGECDDLRERQAAGILDLVDELGADNALLLGDFNSYEEEAPVDIIRGGGFVSAEAGMPDEDRYSYSFDGEFGTLDYVFASSALADAITGIDVWHINSAEAPAYDYNNFNQAALYAPDAFASSDHDPALVGLNLDLGPVADAGGPYTTRVDRNVTLDASGSSDPDTTALTYAWDLDGDGAFDDATGPKVSYGYGLDPGYYTVAVRVSDDTSSAVDQALLTITRPDGTVPKGRR